MSRFPSPLLATLVKRSLAFLQIALLLANGSLTATAQSRTSRAMGTGDVSVASRPTEPPLPKAPPQVELPPPPPMRYVPGLVEPLVATGPVSEQENKDLDAALKAFHAAPAKVGPGGDFAAYSKPLFAFIDAHPQSNWNATLYADIGFGYYGSGYYSRTFTYLEKAWQLGRNADSTQAHLVIDHAVGELAKMHARVGEADQLQALFADIGKRPIGGPATELLQGAREGL